MMKNLSNHCIEDRADRCVYIALNVGYGNIIREIHYIDHMERPTAQYLTDTGVIIVKNPITDTIITVFVATLKQARMFYEKGLLPKWLLRIVMNNSKHLIKQDTVKY